MGAAMCRQCEPLPDEQDKAVDDVQHITAPGMPSEKDNEEVRGFLAQVKLFKRLPKDQMPVLATACKVATFRASDTIIKQGDDGNEFFIIKSGEANVHVSGNKVATLKTGDYFGENALLRDEPRSATISASSELVTYRIIRDDFVRLGLRDKLEFPQRKAVGGGNAREMTVKPPTPKKDEDRRLMADALKRNDNLQSVVEMDEKRINQIIEVAWKETIKAGVSIIKEGDPDADYFYIVGKGGFDILVSSNESKSAEDAQASSSTVGSVGPGGSFGELALLYFAPRAATVKAKLDSEVWVVDRKNFKEILAKSGNEYAKDNVRHLDKVDLLAPLQREEKEAISAALTELFLTKEETIFSQGEQGDTFYILIGGEVSVIKDGVEVTKLAGTPEKACFFGEAALMNNEPRTATIKVISNEAKTLCLDRISFNMLLGPLEELKKRGKGGPSKLKDINKTPLGMDGNKRFGVFFKKDLRRIGLLGCGGFGAVELVEHIGTKESYALKALSKGFIVKCGMQASIMSEKEVQLMCDSKFIIKLYETFNGAQTLYFLLELALGGELYAVYNKKGLFGREDCAKFYSAGVVNAFEHLHQRKIIFRDLKPENLLLTEDGYMKVTDMGLAKVVLGKTYTTCGTPDYFAPELIASSGHSHAVDWWTLGILIFELTAGHPPFESPYPMQIYQKVSKGIGKVTFGSKFNRQCEDLVKSLCKKEAAERLAMKKGGANNIRSHEWYASFNWQDLDSGAMTTPYQPQVKSKTDLTNFTARKADLPPQVKYKEDGSDWDKNFATSD